MPDRRRLAVICVVILAVSAVLCSCVNQQQVLSPLKEDEIRVHFLDVGQGDSILIQLTNGICMLIDGGDREHGREVVSYIRSLGIGQLDYVVATHPHEDHIGGLIEVVKNIPTGKIYMPKVSHTTRTFKEFVDAVIKKEKKFHRAKAGVHIYESGEIKVYMVAPVGAAYENLNNYSAVVKIEYRNVGMLFMGDAEKESEREMDTHSIAAQVLKVGHHGSSSSTSGEFLDAVNPRYAVISAGRGNDYGHPHDETLTLLENSGVEVLRTDRHGTVVISTDGKSIIVYKNK